MAENVKKLLEKAAQATEAHHAMNFAQAALNAAHVFAVMSQIGREKGDVGVAPPAGARMRLAVLRQLASYVDKPKLSGEFYGNRKCFARRHGEIQAWVDARLAEYGERYEWS